jgi:hypothetical protein
MHGVIRRTDIEAELLEIDHWLGANVRRTQRERRRVERDRRLTDADKARRLTQLDAKSRARHLELLQAREAAIEKQQHGQSSPDNT